MVFCRPQCDCSGTLQGKNAFELSQAHTTVAPMVSLLCTMLLMRTRSIMSRHGSTKLIAMQNKMLTSYS